MKDRLHMNAIDSGEATNRRKGQCHENAKFVLTRTIPANFNVVEFGAIPN
jgi:hypothetical protein